MTAESALDLVQVSYDFRIGNDSWLEALAEAAALVAPGDGASVYTFDAGSDASTVEIVDHYSSGVEDRFVQATRALQGASSAGEVDLFYRRGIVTGTVSEQLAREGQRLEDNEAYQQTVAAFGYPDTWGLTASAPDFRGLVLNSPLDAPRKLSGRERRRWRRVGAHLQTAWRIRRSLDELWARSEATFTPDGDPVALDAGVEPFRTQLQQAVQQLEASRRRTLPVDESLELWNALVEGKWSLIEAFDTDERRFYLAVPNTCDVQEIKSLTERERQVVAHIAQGDSNKWAAYQLGVTTGTISNLLSSSLSKLGLTSRAELIWLYNSLR